LFSGLGLEVGEQNLFGLTLLDAAYLGLEAHCFVFQLDVFFGLVADQRFVLLQLFCHLIVFVGFNLAAFYFWYVLVELLQLNLQLFVLPPLSGQHSTRISKLLLDSTFLLR